MMMTKKSGLALAADSSGADLADDFAPHPQLSVSGDRRRGVQAGRD